jgi:hypothetical protein
VAEVRNIYRPHEYPKGRNDAYGKIRVKKSRDVRSET